MRGLTFIEVMIALAIVGLLAASIAIPVHMKRVDTAKENVCVKNRNLIEESEQMYLFDKGEHSAVMQDLVDEGYMKSLPECPAGGVYAWEPHPADSPEYQTRIVCSAHGASQEAGAEGEEKEKKAKEKKKKKRSKK